MASSSAALHEHIQHHRDGTVWARGPMAAGVPEGYWEWFRKDGTKLRSGHFQRGAQVGEWTTQPRRAMVARGSSRASGKLCRAATHWLGRSLAPPR